MAVPGSVVGVGKLITPGGQQGPKGDAGTAANVPLADITQDGLLRKTSGGTSDFVDGTNNYRNLVTAITPTITVVRLRSLNILGNPSFEIDQRNVGASQTSIINGRRMIDRWAWGRVGSHQINSQQVGEFVNVPGTNFMITSKTLVLTLGTAQATLAVGDYGYVFQSVEGPQLRELFNDVHSVSILIKSTKANHNFSYVINDPTSSRSFTKLCTIPTANTWTLITIPNIPVFPPSGTWAISPGNLGAIEGLCFGAGTNFTASTDGVWTNSGALAAPGTDNWFSQPISSTQVTLGFIQHEPGPPTTLIDCPFGENLDGAMGCLRYYQKTWAYSTVVGAVTFLGGLNTLNISATLTQVLGHRFKKSMAKIPTVVPYNPITGGSSALADAGGTNRAVTAINSTSTETPCDTWQVASGLSITRGTDTSSAHYTADTGW